MARTKRKRTPAEIEQAMRDNERLNATPAVPEEPAVKKRRQARRRSKRYNLNKEFQALNVAGEIPAVPVGACVPVENTIAQRLDGHRNEQSPEPTAHLTSSVTAARAVAVPSNSEQPPVLPNAELARRRRAAMTASQQERTRARERERVRIRRANMTGSQRERTRRKEAERQRARRALLSELGRDADRDRNRIQQVGSRAVRPEQERLEVQEIDRLGQEQRREQETIEERETRRERDRLHHEERRATQTNEEAEAERAASREYQASLREARDEEDQVDAPQRERIRRSTVRRGHALANQANFRVSMLSGPNIVNGRHRLPRTTVCPHCNAWKWPAESKNVCCLKGAVRLPPLQPAPPRLLQLYEDAEFRRQIRAYNQVFAFSSIGASCSNRSEFRDVNQDETVAGQHGVYTYRIQGAMGHYLGSLLPRIDRFTNEPMPPKFAQIYIVDPEMQQRAERRRGIFADLESGTLLDIEQMMADHNPFAKQFLNYAEKLRADRAGGKDVVDLVYRLHEKKSNPRTHNLPTVSEVGATLIEDGNLDKPRDILLWAKDHRLLRLFESNPMYDPLQYPLLLPHGESGWTFTDEYADNIERRSKREMSLREHVAYRLFQKVGDESALHQGGRLFQQYCVDQRAKCEQEQLRWIASHQAELRADQYRGVQDALLNEATTVLNEGEVF